MENPVDQSLASYKMCLKTKMLCVKEGGAHADASHLTKLEAAADVSLLAAQVILLESSYEEEIRDLAAEILEKCADDCNTFSEDFMKECAQQCRDSAKALRGEASPGQQEEEATSREQGDIENPHNQRKYEGTI